MQTITAATVETGISLTALKIGHTSHMHTCGYLESKGIWELLLSQRQVQRCRQQSWIWVRERAAARQSHRSGSTAAPIEDSCHRAEETQSFS